MTSLLPDSIPASRPADRTTDRRRDGLRYHGIYFALSCIVLGLAAFLRVDAYETVVVPWFNLPLPESCVYRRLVGTGCPGCGLTRCFIALMDGQWGEAWHYNPAGFLVFLLLASQLPYRIAQIRRVLRGQPELRHSTVSAFLVCLLVFALFGQWLLRQFGVF